MKAPQQIETSPPSSTATKPPMTEAEHCAWFVACLKFHGVDAQPTKESVRRAIIDGYWECAICGKGPDGKSSTFGQTFERAFGEPLMRKRGP
jgi:hypothetical protein